jgi:hypothetical protein
MSCPSPSSHSSYCASVYSFNGSSYPRSPDDMTNITSPGSATPMGSFSPLLPSSPSPSISASPVDFLPGMMPLSPPSNMHYSTGYPSSLSSSPASSHSTLSPYPQEYYRPQSPPSLPQLNTDLYPSQYISSQQQSMHSAQSPVSTARTPRSPYANHRRSQRPIDPTRFEEEEWFTPSGKKVQHSAMHFHCATM